jgi:hypothetical protein
MLSFFEVMQSFLLIVDVIILRELKFDLLHLVETVPVSARVIIFREPQTVSLAFLVAMFRAKQIQNFFNKNLLITALHLDIFINRL